MKFSVITVTLNSEKSIVGCINSVADQRDVAVEHIVKDGISTDKTLEMVLQAQSQVSLYSQKDDGIYDAMNQGFHLCSGDIVSFLNSDDVYYSSSALADVFHAFVNNDCDFVYGDVVIVNKDGAIIRNYTTGDVANNARHLFQIPHPALFVKREVLGGFAGPFDSTYRIAADLKLQLQLMNNSWLKGVYLNRVVVVMQHGGESSRSFKNIISGWIESRRAYNEVCGSGGFLYTLNKVLGKLRGFNGVSGFLSYLR
jgi:glycosyltransferase involved in cell wall biosynthesis